MSTDTDTLDPEVYLEIRAMVEETMAEMLVDAILYGTVPPGYTPEQVAEMQRNFLARG